VNLECPGSRRFFHTGQLKPDSSNGGEVDGIVTHTVKFQLGTVCFTNPQGR